MKLLRYLKTLAIACLAMLPASGLADDLPAGFTNPPDVCKPGKNSIEITVANLWVNRMIGDQRFPDDLEWTDDTGSTAKGQGLVSIPDWVKSGGQRPEPRRKTFYAWKWPHMTADKELLPSGLLGPVTLTAGN